MELNSIQKKRIRLVFRQLWHAVYKIKDNNETKIEID